MTRPRVAGQRPTARPLSSIELCPAGPSRLIMRYLTVAAMALVMIGCGESGPKLVQVTGNVTLNNKPLEGAEVVFTPDASNLEGQPATDMTGPDGNYKAMTR